MDGGTWWAISPWGCKESNTTEWLTHNVFESHLVMSDSLQSQGLQSARFLCPGNSPGQDTGVPSPGDLPNPGIKPRSPTLQADSLLSEPPGKW